MTQLIGRYEQPLFRFILQMVGDAHLAEDLFQETFLRLHRARATYKPGQSLKPYLYRIALNVVNDSRRANAARIQAASLDGTEDSARPLLDALGASSPEPSEEFQRKELCSNVRAAIANLPGNERDVLMLRIFEGLSFAEIAQITDVPVPTAKSRMIYALRRLRPILEKYMSGSCGTGSAVLPVQPSNDARLDVNRPKR
jgi:RNA polymerase sigma-70 factor (ECF subfamily)